MIIATPPSEAKAFELWVCDIYRELGARVKHDVLLLGQQVDVLVEEQKADRLMIRTAVECKAYAGPLPLDETVRAVDHLLPLRHAGKVHVVAICALNGFTRNARLHCEERGVECLTAADLQRGVADFDEYLSRVVAAYAATDVSKHNSFIPLTVEDGRGTPLNDVSSFFERWLESPGQLLTVLGEYGSGKTTSILHLAAMQATKYLRRTAATRVPIIVELRDLSSGTSLRSYLTEFFLTQDAFRIRGMSQVNRWLEEGQFVLLLDGFDEMFHRADPVAVARAMEEITALARGRSKIVVTCRTSFFRDDRDLGRLSPRQSMFRLLDRHDAEIVHVGAATKEQVRHYLSAQLGDGWERWYQTIAADTKLGELVSRPILLFMLVQTIRADRLKTLDSMSHARLYAEYSEMWLERDKGRCRLSIDDRWDISGEVAEQLLRSADFRISERELSSYVKSRFADRKWSEGDLDDAAKEVRVCTFLKNRVDGYYSFAHRSFAEFLTARYMLKTVRLRKFEVLLEPYTTDTYQFFLDLCAMELTPVDATVFQEAMADERWAGTAVQAVALRVLARRSGDFSSFELKGLAIPEGTEWSSLVLANQRLPSMRAAKIVFDKTDFAHSILDNGVFEQCSFAECLLVSSHFRNARFTNCKLFGADLRSAIFDGAAFQDTVLTPFDALARQREEILNRVGEIQRRLGHASGQWDNLMAWSPSGDNAGHRLVSAARLDLKVAKQRLANIERHKKDEEEREKKRISALAPELTESKQMADHEKKLKRIRRNYHRDRIHLQLCRRDLEDAEMLGDRLTRLTKDDRYTGAAARRKYAGASFSGCTGLSDAQRRWLHSAGAHVD